MKNNRPIPGGFRPEYEKRIVRMCSAKGWALCDIRKLEDEILPEAYNLAPFAVVERVVPRRDYLLVPEMYIPEGEDNIIADRIDKYGIILPRIVLHKNLVRKIKSDSDQFSLNDLPDEYAIPVNSISLKTKEIVLRSRLPRSRFIQNDICASFSMSYHPVFLFHLSTLEDSLTSWKRRVSMVRIGDSNLGQSAFAA